MENTSKKSFKEACIECKSIPLDEFIAELRRSIHEEYARREATERAVKAVTKRKTNRPTVIQPNA